MSVSDNPVQGPRGPTSAHSPALKLLLAEARRQFCATAENEEQPVEAAAPSPRFLRSGTCRDTAPVATQRRRRGRAAPHNDDDGGENTGSESDDETASSRRSSSCPPSCSYSSTSESSSEDSQLTLATDSASSRSPSPSAQEERAGTPAAAEPRAEALPNRTQHEPPEPEGAHAETEASARAAESDAPESVSTAHAPPCDVTAHTQGDAPPPPADPLLPGAKHPGRKKNSRRKRRNVRPVTITTVAKTGVRSSAPPAAQDTASTSEGRETVLYRPLGRKAHFLAASRDAIAAFLAGVSGTHRVRPNLRRNVVAVDALPGTDLSALLAVRVICDVPVKAKALIADSCTGTLFNVDPAIDGPSILEGIESRVPVLAVTRSGDVATLRFTGRDVPEEVHLFRQRRIVRPQLPRPLQCGRCGLFGHATATCSRDPRCLQCAGSHATTACTSKRTRCINCRGPHESTEPRCPNWQLERRVASILARTVPRITRKQALVLARSNAPAARNQQPATTTAQRAPEPRSSPLVQPGRSFRDVLAGNTAPQPAAESSSAQPRSTTTPDARDLVITTLASALRALLESVPADSPARHMCVAALEMHDALIQHG
ncbi:DNA translocase FtsK 1-like [Dermacentor albipictus]|uniref:DNA translocase FtsK 1-like n=1 Tax=Dermacentor albipictus TaxID=60249 RepID=UPI0038FC0181